jgi:hypothetical protein
MKAIIVSISFLGLVFVALADDVRSQIKILGTQVSAALMKKDIAAFSAAMKGNVTSDFKYYDNAKAKPMTFDQMVGGMKMGLAMISQMKSADDRLLSLKTVGDTTTAKTIHSLVGLIADPKTKRNHTMSFSGVSVDVFKKVGGSWKMSSMTWLSQGRKMDGVSVSTAK